MLIDAHAALPLALLVAIAAGAASAAVVGALAITGRGVYGVMLTFAFNEMAYYIAFQWRDATGGDNGLRGIPRPDVFGISLDDATRYYYFTAVVVLLAVAVVLRINVSPFGAVLRAIRENEERARAIGYHVRRFKVAAFAISGALSGLAGGLYAELYRFVPLQAIDLDTSTNIVVAALLGGIGSSYGALLGAAIFIVLSNSLSHVWSHWPLILGLVFCAVVLFFRGGLWGITERWSRRAAHV
ncbi:MAG: branched-chain amino acid transport system permease protein [Candidatus Eremiobacteraeota bacterium]|nr:branched-chain amino acid transport system permease protein [Candidatus Eremiobacteraeota bacterium]